MEASQLPANCEVTVNSLTPCRAQRPYFRLQRKMMVDLSNKFLKDHLSCNPIPVMASLILPALPIVSQTHSINVESLACLHPAV